MGRSTWAALPLMLTLAVASRADSLRAPFSYTKRAADGRHVFVMLGEDDDEGLRKRYPSSGLYRGDATTPLWTVDWYAYRVEVADDGEHVVRLGHWMSGLDEEALALVARGQVLRAYSLRDLLGDAPPTPRTASYATLRGHGALDGAAMTFTQSTAAGDAYVFDLRTGELVRRTRAPGQPPGEPAHPRPDVTFEQDGAVRVAAASRVGAQLVPRDGGWGFRCKLGDRLVEGQAWPTREEIAARAMELVRVPLTFEGDASYGLRDVTLEDDHGKRVGASLHAEPGGRRADLLVRPATLVEARSLRVTAACGLTAPPAPLVLEGPLPLSRRLEAHGLSLDASARWAVDEAGQVELVTEVTPPPGRPVAIEVRGAGDLRLVASQAARPEPPLVRARFTAPWLPRLTPVDVELRLPLEATVRAEVHGRQVAILDAKLERGLLQLQVHGATLAGDDPVIVEVPGWENGGGSGGPKVTTFLFRSRGAAGPTLGVRLRRRTFDPPAERARQRIELLVSPTRLYRADAALPPG